MTSKIDAVLEATTMLLEEGIADAEWNISALTELMSRAMADEPDRAPVLLWSACDKSWDVPQVRRIFSYVLARYLNQLDDRVAVILLDLLSPPYTRDLSAITNCLTILQRFAAQLGECSRILAPSIGYFLLDVIKHRSVVEQVVEVLDAFSIAKVHLRILTKPISERICESLKAALSQMDDDTKVQIAALAKKLNDSELPAHYDDIIPTLSQYRHRIDSFVEQRLSRHQRASITARLTDFFEKTVAFESFCSEAIENKHAAHNIRVTGNNADLGRVPIDFFERILRAWRLLYAEVGKGIDGAHLPDLFIMAPEKGSFLIRVSPNLDSSQLGTEASAIDEIAEYGQRTSEVLSAEGNTDGAARQYVNLVRLTVDHRVDLDIGMVASKPIPTIRRFRVNHRVVEGYLNRATAEVAEANAPLEIVYGTLDAASHRTGKFEILRDDNEEILRGTVPPGDRGILLKKTIGEHYEFEVSKVPGPNSSDPKWHLQRIRAAKSLQSQPKTTPSTPPAGASKTLDSMHIPQQDKLIHVIRVVELIAGGSVPSPANMGLDKRHVGYSKHAARCLGLISDDGTLLAAGSSLVSLNSARRLDLLAIQFEISVCGRDWMRWAQVDQIGALDPDTATKFLRNATNLSHSMIVRRGRTLRRWANELGKRQ